MLYSKWHLWFRVGLMTSIFETFIGFDSAWMGNLKAPGAICAVTISDDTVVRWHPPELVGFEQALAFISNVTAKSKYSLVAIDQPTVVPNLISNRPVNDWPIVWWDGTAAELRAAIVDGLVCFVMPALFGDF